MYNPKTLEKDFNCYKFLSMPINEVTTIDKSGWVGDLCNPHFVHL